MVNTLKFNIPIYLVSLEQDTKRREELKLRFPNHYDDFIQINAVDGRKISAKEYYDKTIEYFIKTNKTMSPSELGCTLSHIKALEEFIKTNNNYALILEDDVIGEDKDIKKIIETAQRLDENTLFICGGQDGLNVNKYLIGKKYLINELYQLSKFSHKHVLRTCCYVITKKTATLILNHHKNSLTLADKWDNFFDGQNIRIVFQNILKHPIDLSHSHIENERVKLRTKKFFFVSLFKRIYIRLYNEIALILHLLMNNKKVL